MMRRYLHITRNILLWKTLSLLVILCCFGQTVVAMDGRGSGATKSVSARSIELNVSSLYLRVGEHKVLSATVLPSVNTEREVVWIAENAACVRVDAQGRVKALRVGVTKVVASLVDGEVRAECKVVVTPAYSVQERVFDEVHVGPNPFAGVLRITNDEFRSGSYELVNARGVVVRTCKVEDRITEIDTNDLARGVYLLIVTNDELQVSETVRIMRE